MCRLAPRVLIALIAATPTTSNAADFWWRGDVNGNWNTAVPIPATSFFNTNFSNDSNGLVDRFSLPGPSDLVRFSSSNASNLTTNLGQNFSIQGLTTETTLPQNVSISGISTLTLGTGGIVTNAPRTLTVNAFLTTNQLTLPINTASPASVVTFNTVTQGDFLLHKSGPGTLNLNSTGGHAFGTTVSNGTLNTFAVNAVPFFSRLTLGDATDGNTPRFNTNGFAANLALLTIYAPSSSATVIDVGNSTLTLAGNLSVLNTLFGSGNRFGATIAAAAGGTFNLNGNVRTFTIAGQNISQDELVIKPVITNGGIILNANPSTFNGAQAGMVLDAAAPNTYTGGTTVNAGVLRVNANTTLGPGPLTLNTTGSVASIVRFNNSFQTIASLSTTTVGSAVPVVELNDTNLTINQSTNTTFAGSIQGTRTVNKTGPGKLTLTGANASAPTLNIDDGTLEIGNGGTSGSFSGRININSALIFNRSDNHTHSGLITGSGSFTKLGTGTLTLSNGPNQFFSGPVFISQGVITAAAINVFSFRNANLTVGHPTLTDSAVFNAANFNQSFNNLDLYARLSGAQEAILVGTSTLSVGGDIKVLDHQADRPGNRFPTIIAAEPGGKLELRSNSKGGEPTQSIIIAGQNNTARNDLIIQPVITGSSDIEITASPSIFNGAPAGVVFAAASPNTYTGNTTVNAGTLTVNSSTSLGQSDLIINTTGNVASEVRLNNPTQSIGELKSSALGLVLPVLNLNGTELTVKKESVFPGIITGTGSIKLGEVPSVGRLGLTGNNTYTGTTTINPGWTLEIANGGTTGSITGNIINNGALTFNRSNDTTYAGSISGTGTLTKNGVGILTLIGNNTHTGGTTISADTLQIGNGGTGGSITGNIINDATLVFNRSDNRTLPNNISGWGKLTHASSATLVLTGTLSYTGDTSVAGGGRLVLNSALNTTAGDVLLSTDGRVDFARPRSTSPVVVSTIDNLTVPNGGIARVTPSTRTGGLQQGVLIVNTLSISGTGFLDLTNNDLIVRSQSLTSVRSLVATWLTSSNGLPGTTGLGSSAAFYTPEGAFTTLAVYDNSLPSQTLTTFEGVAVTPSDILVKYTYLGDTNLDGVVDATDLSRLLQGLNGEGSGWNFGDINYDGQINFTDLGRTMAALRGQGAPLSTTGSGTPGGVIPEPASLALLSLPALALLRLPRAKSSRRRR